MRTGRVEAFSDGVIAILITIMVLELHAPKEPTWHELVKVLPILLAYLLSFVYLGIYWNNHHHLLARATRVRGPVLWANLHLLFWLSLVPFITGWMSETGFATVPVATYGLMLLLAAGAFTLLTRTLVASNGGAGSPIARALGRNLKGKSSLVLYLVGIALTFVSPYLGLALYAIVALIWLVPDPRLERQLDEDEVSAAGAADADADVDESEEDERRTPARP
jgi:uncharacterized membrane protein